MKKLIRRLSRVSDSSSPYLLLQQQSESSSFRTTSTTKRVVRRTNNVPQGHLPVYVGEEMERFVVNADLLNHPVFINLLNKSAQEYGYEQQGVLRIPCHVFVFERFLEALRCGKHVDLAFL
uniref:auxin-responsive protein SAUR72-like n=1 Tax=Erigeron canadensis TaxID=72917 RepID=UPI001CB9A27F|nr:auxin-responsive protein SAUR72-like [Erigeron canadensis]